MRAERLAGWLLDGLYTEPLVESIHLLQSPDTGLWLAGVETLSGQTFETIAECPWVATVSVVEQVHSWLVVIETQGLING